MREQECPHSLLFNNGFRAAGLDRFPGCPERACRSELERASVRGQVQESDQGSVREWGLALARGWLLVSKLEWGPVWDRKLVLASIRVLVPGWVLASEPEWGLGLVPEWEQVSGLGWVPGSVTALAMA